MSTQLYDLFTYPQVAGYKREGTSQAAAQSINAAGLRAKVLQCIREQGPATADEAAERLHLTPFSVRPRCTELQHLGKLVDSGIRRRNSSGRQATVWRVP